MYLLSKEDLDIEVTSEKYPSGTEEVEITFTETKIGNTIPSSFSLKVRSFDHAIALAQDLSDKVVEEFKKSRREMLGKGGNTQKENIKGLSVLNS